MLHQQKCSLVLSREREREGEEEKKDIAILQHPLCITDPSVRVSNSADDDDTSSCRKASNFGALNPGRRTKTLRGILSTPRCSVHRLKRCGGVCKFLAKWWLSGCPEHLLTLVATTRRVCSTIRQERLHQWCNHYSLPPVGRCRQLTCAEDQAVMCGMWDFSEC